MWYISSTEDCLRKTDLDSDNNLKTIAVILEGFL